MQKNIPRLRTIAIVSSVLAGCMVTQTVQDPFAIPRQVFFDSVQTVVVTSATVVGETVVEDTILSLFERLIEERLLEVGLSVVTAAEYAAIWDSIAEESGGFFDPYTGARDEERFGVAVDDLNAELAERYSFDALLFPEIWEVEVPFSNGEARWGGYGQLVAGGRGFSGDILAATLFVAIQDTAGNEFYTHEAGIHLLEYMLRGDLTPLPPARLFGDSTRITAAVARALAPLAEGSPNTPQ